MALFGGEIEKLDNLKRAMLRKFPSLGTTVSKLKLKYSKREATAATDGVSVFFNPKYMDSLTYDEQIFVMTHETMHVAFDHIKRQKNRKGELKDMSTWNIATDAVINQMLKAEGLPMPKGVIDKPEAIDKSAEEMYKILYERKLQRRAERQKRREEQQQAQQGEEGQQGQQDQQQDQQQQGQNDKQKQNEQQGSCQNGKEQQEDQENQEGNKGKQKGKNGKGQQDEDDQQQEGEDSEGQDDEKNESQKGNGNSEDKKEKDDKQGSEGQSSGDGDEEDEEDEDSESNGGGSGKQGEKNGESKSKSDSSQSQGDDGDDEDFDDNQAGSGQNLDPDDFDDDELENGQNAPTNHDIWKDALEKMEKKQKKNKGKDKDGEDDDEDKNESDDEDEGESEEDKFRRELEEDRYKDEKDSYEEQNREKNEGGEGENGQSEEEKHYEELEKEFRDKNKELKRKMAERVRKRIAERSHESGKGEGGVIDSFGSIGEAEQAVVPWQKILKKNFVKTEYRWSDRRATKSNGFSSRIDTSQTFENPSTEIVLDTSGSVNDRLLRGFLRQVKTILNQAYGKLGGAREIKLKIGCFSSIFYGFTEIKTMEDIDKYRFQGRGGTSIDAAVQAFSKDKKVNKIVFTDGEDYSFPKGNYSDINCIYVIFDNPRFKAPNGTTIYVNSKDVYMDNNLSLSSSNFSDDEDERY